jgi:hypothetical protein
MLSKIPFITSIIAVVLYKVISYYLHSPWLALLIFLIPMGMLLSNFALRKKLKYRNWFNKPWNKFLESKTEITHVDLSQSLLYSKLIADAEISGYKLIDQNDSTFELLYSTSVNFWTWGENIYVKIKVKDSESSTIEFTSLVLFGSYSWKRNQSNFENYFAAFENSLTI